MDNTLNTVLVAAYLVNAVGMLVAGIAMWRLSPPPYLHTLCRLFSVLGVVGCLTNVRGAWVAQHYEIVSWPGLFIRLVVFSCVAVWLYALWQHRRLGRKGMVP